MKDRLRKMIEAYRKEIQTAYSCNQCYFDMSYYNERNSEWERVYQIAPAFFNIARKSMQTEAFLTLCRMYEPEGRADSNLYKLLGFISGNAKMLLSMKIVQKCRRKLTTLLKSK